MRRWLLAALLICAFIILAASYVPNVASHLDYPRESEVNADYAAYLGRNVTITGSVVTVGAQSFALKGMQHVYIVLSSEMVQRGDSVTVLGSLEPGFRLHAMAISASPCVLSALVYVRSFVALVFVVVLFFKGWRFEWRGWVIMPRDSEHAKRRQDGD